MGDTDMNDRFEHILEEIYQNKDIEDKQDWIDPLQCILPMTLYYQCIDSTIRELVGEKNSRKILSVSRMSPGQVREFRRYINSDLDNLGIEFYLQRLEWARKCRAERNDGKKAKEHEQNALNNPAKHPCRMRRKHGFRRIVDGEDKDYTYEQFLSETLPIFIAIHNHLVSINTALGNLYNYVTGAPFSGFTPTGKTEILHMTRGLERIMRGLLVATHLQPQRPWQKDVANYLISCRADCQRFFETIPRYYQTHRMRLVVFPIDPLPDEDKDEDKPDEGVEPHILPLACLPWSAGAYLDFLTAYESIAKHIMASLAWALRLYSLWFFVPRRYLRLISPILRV